MVIFKKEIEISDSKEIICEAAVARFMIKRGFSLSAILFYALNKRVEIFE